MTGDQQQSAVVAVVDDFQQVAALLGGRKFRTLNDVDDFTHECLAVRVARKLDSTHVIDVLSDLFILCGVPEHIRSDNGPEFIAKAVQKRIATVGSKTAFIPPGSP